MSRGRLAAMAVVFLLLAAVVLVISLREPPARTGAVFTGLGLVAAVGALAAAVAAIRLALPSYLQIRADLDRRVDIDLRLAVLSDSDDEDVIGEEPKHVDGLGCDLLVRAENVGERLLDHAILNVVVLDECEIRGIRVHAGIQVLTGTNEEICPGETRRVRFVGARPEHLVAPHVLVTYLRLVTPRAGSWPILVTIGGSDGDRPYDLHLLPVRHVQTSDATAPS